VLARAGLLLAGVFEFRVDVSKRIRSKVRSENCNKKQRVQAEAGRKRQISGFWVHASTLLVVKVRIYHCTPSLKQQRSFWPQKELHFSHLQQIPIMKALSSPECGIERRQWR
jgi:SPX domain protein involved in polyphosphate accumulation